MDRKRFSFRPAAAYRLKRRIAIWFETIGFGSLQERHPHSALMKPVIGECHWFVVIRALPNTNVEGHLIRCRNLFCLSCKLTPLSTTVINVKTCPSRRLTQDRY